MDQADRLRAMVSGSEKRARVIAIASGKGGVGKTNLAVNLAFALSQRGKKVILIDVDIGLANADVLLGVQPRMNLGHVLSGEVSVLDALVPVAEGVSLLPGAAGIRHLSDLERTEREFLLRSFRDLEARGDFIVVDTAAGISRNVVQFAATADEVLVVTTPEPPAITDGYAAIKAISREKGFGRIRVVVNMANDAEEAGRVFERIRTVSRKFLGIEVDWLGWIAPDELVRQAVRRKKPFILEYPKAAASECLRTIAARILAEEPPLRSAGFLKRFASAFQKASV